MKYEEYKNPYKIIEVRWVDANGYDRQYSVNFDFRLAPVDTVGYLISEDKDKIVLAREIFIDPEANSGTLDVRATIAIPKKWIIKRSNK